MVNLLLGSKCWSVVSCTLLCVSLLPTSFSQGTAADYDRMDKYAKSLDACVQPTIALHWLSTNDTFWYRKASAKGSFEFFFVDAVKKIRRAAFDHARLAQALSTKNIPATASLLPLTWINPTSDGTAVRFYAGNSKWQFDSNGNLAPFSGELNEARLLPIVDDFSYTTRGGSTTITFVNRAKTAFSIFWVTPSGALSDSYGTVEAGQSKTINAFEKDVWTVKTVTGKNIASFRATSEEAQVIIEGNLEKRFEQDDRRHVEMVLDRFDSFTEPLNAPVLNIKVADEHIVSNVSTQNRGLSSIMDIPSKAVGGKITRWYPSSVTKFSVVYDTTPSQQHPVYMVESSPNNQTQPLLRTIKELTMEEYLKPGDNVAVDRPRLYKGLEEIRTDDALFKNPWSIQNMGWNADGSEYRFLFNQRGHRIIRIIGINLDGRVRLIHEESSKTFIDYAYKIYSYGLSRNTKASGTSRGKPGDEAGKDELIWASERDGWNHLYLLDMRTGTLKQITKGEWAMRSVEFVNEEKRQIWFTGFGMVPGQDYYHAHLARINFDGSGMKVFTSDGDGTHTWKWSPGRKYLTDTYSRVDMAPKILLRNGETGEPIVALEEGNLDCLRTVGWTVPERFVAPGRDGKTDIYGIIIKPSNFDPNKKYPIIENIYAGPQDFFVPKPFSLLLRQHEYTELGFIVVQIDGMGTNWRSKAFHDVCAKNLKDAGLPDRIAWMKAAQKERPWMDITRVGIYGGSAGGQNAMSAVLFHPDFYKAAAADSGCHDNRMDKIWWNEAWMGWPVDKSYEESSNVVNAAKLEGALMLFVGELDSNVDPASTAQVVDALIKAGKDHELVSIPGAGHGVTSSVPYALRKQRDFFVRELLGVQPPKRNGKGN